MIRILGSDDTVLSVLLLVLRWIGDWPLLEYSAYGGGTQVQTGPCQDLGDLHLAQHRAEGFELLDEITHEIGKLVDRLAKLDQGFGTLFIDPL